MAGDVRCFVADPLRFDFAPGRVERGANVVVSGLWAAGLQHLQGEALAGVAQDGTGLDGRARIVVEGATLCRRWRPGDAVAVVDDGCEGAIRADRSSCIGHDVCPRLACSHEKVPRRPGSNSQPDATSVRTHTSPLDGHYIPVLPCEDALGATNAWPGIPQHGAWERRAVTLLAVEGYRHV